MKKHLFFAACLATALFSACNNNEVESVTDAITGTKVATFTIANLSVARATTSSENYTTTFAEGDKIGIYSSGLVDANNQSSNMENALFSISGSKLTAEETSKGYYFPKLGDASFYAYYPADNSATGVGTIEATTTSVAFTVSNDQSDATMFANNDFMTASCTTSNTTEAISLNFTHQLALVEVTLSGMDDIISVTMNGVQRKVTYTYATGVIATGNSESGNIQMYNVEGNRWWGLVPEQEIAQNSVLFTLSSSTNSYTYTVAAAKTLSKSNVNKFTLSKTIIGNKVSISDASPAITDWTDPNTTLDNGTIEAKNYIVMPTTAIKASAQISTTTANDPWGYNCTSAEYSEGVFNITGIADGTQIGTGSASWFNRSLIYFSNETLSKGTYTLSFKAKTNASPKNIYMSFIGLSKIEGGTQSHDFYQIVDGTSKFTNKLFTVTSTGQTYIYKINTAYYINKASTNSNAITTETWSDGKDQLNGFKICMAFQDETFTISELKLTKDEPESSNTSDENEGGE